MSSENNSTFISVEHIDPSYAPVSTWICLVPTRRMNKACLPRFVFPLYVKATYSVGSSSDNNFILPSTKEKHSTIRVDGKGKVKILSTVDEDHLITTAQMFHFNNRMLDNTQVFDKLLLDQQIWLADFCYNLDFAVEPNVEFYCKFLDLKTCCLCFVDLISPRTLLCGHLACERCVVDKINEALDFQNVGCDVLCLKCAEKSSLQDFIELKDPPILKRIVESCALYRTEKKCRQCRDSRSEAISLYDHYMCEDCDFVVCPLCALEKHREHNLTAVYHITRQLSIEYQKKTLRSNCKYEKFRRDFLERKRMLISPFLPELKDRIVQKVESAGRLLPLAEYLYGKLQKMDAYDLGYKELLNLFHSILVNLKGAIQRVFDDVNKSANFATKVELQMKQSIAEMKSTSARFSGFSGFRDDQIVYY